MEKADIKKKINLALVALIIYIQKGTGFSTSPSALTSCASSTANISYNFSIDAGETIIGKRIWFFGTAKIAESDGTTLTPVPSYSSRLAAYGSSGISLSNITVADAGTYTYVIVLLPTLSPFTATTSLSVQVAPLAPPSGCQVSSWNQPGNIPTCAVNTNSGNCGTPSLIAFLVNYTNTSSQFICKVGETYQCCATSAALTCYSGSSNDFCKLFTCTEPPQCNLELGLGLGLGFGIPFVIIFIVFVIFKYRGYKHAYTLGRVLGLGLGIAFIVGCIIIAILISTGTTSCKNELGLGLGLGSGIPCLITIIIAVIFVFFSFPLFEGISSRVKFGRGILTGLLYASVIGIIVEYMYLNYNKLKRGLKYKERMTKNSRPTSVHTRTPKKAEPNTNSKKTNDRQQPMPPANTGFEDNPTFRPLPPQNGEIKDRKVRGISATIGDTPDLASETPRPNKLPPILLKQETVQEENVSEEPKKKRKKKKKKDQMNVETPEEENGETDTRVKRKKKKKKDQVNEKTLEEENGETDLRVN